MRKKEKRREEETERAMVTYVFHAEFMCTIGYRFISSNAWRYQCGSCKGRQKPLMSMGLYLLQ